MFAAAAAVVWVLQVAPLTDQYPWSIFDRTFQGVASSLTDTSQTRQLFESSSGEQAELWERAVGLSSVALIALALPFGLWRIWRRRGRYALLVVLGLAAAAYLAILPLRLVPRGWETANRASDFLFVGIGLTVALAGLHLLWRGWRASWLLSSAAAVFSRRGGASASWAQATRSASASAHS